MIDYTLLHFKEYLYEQLNLKYNSDSSLEFKQIISACVPTFLKKNNLTNEETEKIKRYARQLIMAQTEPKKIIEFLNEATIEYNHPRRKKEFTKMTPLVEAMLYGDVKTTKDLIKNGADVNEPAELYYAKRMPIDISSELNKHRVLFTVLLINAGADVKNSKALFHTVTKGDIPFTEELVTKYGCDVNQVDSSGCEYGGDPDTPLIKACHQGNINMIKKLIELGAETQSYKADVALNAIIHQGSVEGVQILLEAGVNARGFHDDSESLCYATARGETQIADILLNAGADIDAIHQYTDYTPLMIAIESNHMETAKRLIERGADVFHKTCSGKTASVLLSQMKDKTPLHQEVENMIQAKIKAITPHGNSR